MNAIVYDATSVIVAIVDDPTYQPPVGYSLVTLPDGTNISNGFWKFVNNSLVQATDTDVTNTQF